MKISLYFKIMALTLLAVGLGGAGLWLLALDGKSAIGWLFTLGSVILAMVVPTLFTRPFETLLAPVENFLVTDQPIQLPHHPVDPLLGRLANLLNALLQRLKNIRERIQLSEQSLADLRLKSERERQQERESQQQWQQAVLAKDQELAASRDELKQITLQLQNAYHQRDELDALALQLTTAGHQLQQARQNETALRLELSSCRDELQQTARQQQDTRHHLDDRLHQKQAEIDTLTLQTTTLGHQLQQARQNETALKQELADQKQETDALTLQIGTTSHELQLARQNDTALRLELAGKKHALESLTRQTGTLDQELQQTRQVETSLRLELATLQKVLLERQGEMLTLQEKKASLIKNLQNTQQALQSREQELALITSQLERLNNALDQHAIVSLADMDGRILQVNALFCQTSGYTMAELIGQNHSIINSGYHTKSYYQEMWNTLLSGHVWHGEIRNRAKNGQYYWVKGTIVPFLDAGGKPTQFMAIRTDITRQKEAEEQARAMALFAQFNPNPMLRVDDHGLVIKANPAASVLLELSGQTPSPLLHHLPAVQEVDWHTCIQQSETLLFCARIEHRYYQFMVQGVPELAAAHVYGVETTQTVEAEKKLRLNHHFLLQIATHMGEGVYALDQNGRLTFINREAQRLLGWSEEELLGKAIHDVIHYQDLHGEPVAHDSCPVLQTIRSGQIYRVVEDVFTHRDGHLIPVAFTSSPLLEGQQVVGSVNVFQDITQRKQIDQEIRQARDLALEASRLKSEFLANMSHEIRTPMNGIIGMTDLLLDTKLNKEQRELAITARESAQALLTIINDILDFSKIEAGKLEFETAEFSPLRVVEGVAELVAPQAQKKNLDIICDIAPQVPPVLKGDPGRIRQVLLNLAGNAVKFTRKGEVVLAATLDSRDETHANLRFSVSDTGIGVAKSAHHRLFQPFTQVDGSSSREYGGTGLGLSISSRLVEMMGGEIGLTSKKGKGSTFWFTVPLLLASTTEVEREPAILPRLKGTKVLLTVRNQTSQTILMNHLINWNMRCTAVESPEEAMAILRHDAQNGVPFLLAIVDDTPADQEALELIGWIHREESLKDTRILLFTAAKDESYQQRALQAGVTAFLFKPLRQGNLLESIAHLFMEPTENREEPHGDRPAAIPPTEQQGRTVLLAEDNPVNQKVSQMQIHRLGYAVHTVSNGKDAVDAAMTGQYAMILMDCQMPLMNGFEASQTIRRLEMASHRHIPIVALTANAMKGDRERCLEAGMDDYLSKPVEFQELEAKLRQWLPGPSTPAEPPLAIDSLNALFDGNKEVVRESLQSFMTAATLLLNEMAEQINRQDRPAIRKNIAAIQEAGQQLEANALCDLCRRMDAVCSVGDWKQAKLLLEEMRLQFHRLDLFIQSLATS